MVEDRSPEGASADAARVGIVEDDRTTAMVLREILERAGHEVAFVARSESEARARLVTDPADLVLMDISLGETGDGVGLVQSLGPEAAPVVYVSASGDARTLERAGRTRPLGFIVKPFSEAQVQATVEVALSQRTRRRTALHVDEAPDEALRRVATILAGIDLPARGSLRQVSEPELARSLETLSSREWEILRGMVAHRRVPGMAKALFISQHTVRNHIKSIFTKLDVHSQEDLFDLLIRKVRSEPGSDGD